MHRTPAEGDLHDPLSLGQDSRDRRRVGPGEHVRRRSLLHEDPDIQVVDMATLAGIAKAIEDEAVTRYDLLARLMDERGEPATAAAFRTMLEEERSHVLAVERWAEAVGEAAARPVDFEWLLPADLSSSWDAVCGSALLTPYRAFAVAVDNEERAFSFYAYLAAHAEDARTRAEAEKLGKEELRHASLLRRWRRRAYHRERRTAPTAQVPIDSVEALHHMLARHEAAIAAVHLALVPRLEAAGDEASARLLERAIPASTQQRAPVEDPGADPRHLLVDAQKPLEALADVLEAVMATAEGALFQEAAAAMDRVIGRIAQIALQAGDAADS